MKHTIRAIALLRDILLRRKSPDLYLRETPIIDEFSGVLLICINVFHYETYPGKFGFAPLGFIKDLWYD